MNFRDRFGAAFPGGIPGLSLTGAPMMGPVPLPQPRPLSAEVPAMVYPSPGGPATDPSAPPFRLDRSAMPPVPMASAAPSTAPTFPIGGAPPVPHVSGLTLNSNPQMAGWAGTAGLSPTPGSEGTAEVAPSMTDNLAKAIPGLEDIAKGLKAKAADPTANQIIPSNMQPNTGASNAAELMTALLNSKRQRTGISLYGSM